MSTARFGTGMPAGFDEDPAPVDRVLLRLFLAGAAVSLTLGLFGRLHPPTGIAVNVAGFSGPLEVKVWLCTLSAALAVVQLVTARAMYGRLDAFPPGPALTSLHRWSGRVAFLAAVPVAMHCLYALGFQATDTRVLLHSLFGCLFFGAFTTKMLVLPRRGMPGWALPLLGGAVFTALVAVWLTSGLWFFLSNGIRW